MVKSMGRKSRRKTPWDGVCELTATQMFLKEQYKMRYADRHGKVSESGESALVNSFSPMKCPFCGGLDFIKRGFTAGGIQRYLCACKKAFVPTTGTIFDEHKLSISEWIEYCLNLFRHVSINADSWNNKNAFTTSRYWLQKLFLALEGVQDNIVLSGSVWLDETYYTVRSEDIIYNEGGNKLRGISKNQIRVGVATDKVYTLFLVEGKGKPSQKKTWETFGKRIMPKSTLIHDKEPAHKKLIKELSLKSVSYASRDLKSLLDKDNPLYPVNRAHAIMKMFLNAHSGFNRDYLQGYLNLFSLVTNPPEDMLEKVELIIISAFNNPKKLRYRDFYNVNTEF
jgi:transposase-like protein